MGRTICDCGFVPADKEHDCSVYRAGNRRITWSEMTNEQAAAALMENADTCIERRLEIMTTIIPRYERVCDELMESAKQYSLKAARIRGGTEEKPDKPPIF